MQEIAFGNLMQNTMNHEKNFFVSFCEKRVKKFYVTNMYQPQG